MLPALAARAVCIDAQVFRANVDLNGVVDFRRNINAGKRSMPPLRRIERRNPHQPMHSRFARQKTKGILTRDGEGSRFDARLIPILVVVHLGLIAILLRPAQVHAHQHLSPVLAFRPAGARMHGNNGVQRIGLAREHRLGLKRLAELAQRIHLPLQVRQHFLGSLARQLKIRLDIPQPAHQLLVIRNQHFQPFAVAHQRLAGGRIRPQRRIFQFFPDGV